MTEHRRNKGNDQRPWKERGWGQGFWAFLDLVSEGTTRETREIMDKDEPRALREGDPSRRPGAG